MLLLGTKEAWTPLPWRAMEGVPDFLRGRGWMAAGSLYSTDSQPGSLDEYMKSFLKRLLLAGSLLCWSAQASWRSTARGPLASSCVQAGRPG